jgi:hypothetical protein
VSCFDTNTDNEGRFGTIRRVLQDLSIEILADINIRPNETNAATLTGILNGLKPQARG